VTESVSDTPELRAWLYSVSHVVNAFSRDHGDLPTTAIHHIRLDTCEAARIADLLRFQALGLLTGNALAAAGDMHFETTAHSPPYLALPNIGRLDFSDATPALSIDVRDGTINISTDSLSAMLSESGELLKIAGDVRFSPAVRFSMLGCIREIPIPDPALFQPAFQTLPQVAGYSAATKFAHRIREAAGWLDRLNLPNARDILAWCRAFMGLASFGHRFGSASRMEALGLIYLPSQGPRHELAESLLHEAMHQHLSRLDAVAPLFTEESDIKERYYSPWRDDPRPLIMTLHGAYVFTAVAEIYSRCLDVPNMGVDHGEASAITYRRTRQAIAALDTVRKNAILTHVGRRVVAQTHAHATSLLERSDVPRATCDAINSDLARHRQVHSEFLV